MKRIRLRTAILSMVLLGAAPVARTAETAATRPNVVILLTDDQGTLDVNCSGISVADHASEKPEIVRELTALHDAWAKNLPAE